jgi:predicted flap endonuclease-1-like 5' DNA nuclease
MLYLISQLFLSLLAVFFLGFLAGWFVKSFFEREESASKEKQVSLNTSTSTQQSFMPPPPPPVNNNFEEKTAEEKPKTKVTKAKAAPKKALEGLSKKGYEIETLEGVGPKTGKALRDAGINTIGDLLEKTKTAEERATIAKQISVRPKMVESWVSMADILRITEIDHQTAELLVKTGVADMTDLSERAADDLEKAMQATNTAGKRSIAPEVPKSDKLSAWIQQARDLAA